jgi:DNA-binding SARP family transcriptional activator/tetratricopeptide (TPR) repeat protein
MASGRVDGCCEVRLGGLRVRVLGQLEVSVDGRGVGLTTGRLRTLVAVLAMAAGRSVSMEQLTDAIWAEATPESPRRSLQTYATRLRRELGDCVVSHAAGLVLDVGREAVDALRFERILAEASAQSVPEQERRLLDEALDLWRGEPFEGVASRWLEDVERPRLVERRLAAVERRVDLDLAAGRHSELVGELNEWTARYPMRESLWVRLLIVLDRCGRRADALDRYEQIRVRIADELGVDPSPELQQVYTDLLSDRPAGAGLARSASGAVGSVPARVTVPRQLPAPPSAFVGRSAELAQLDHIGDSSAVVITAIEGMAGVGKTALAIHAAQRLASRYPDGQLFLDLHGFTDGIAPVDPGDALDRMLRSLGVPGDLIPPGLDDRAALFRSQLADRRVLLLLDNATTEAQVTPLLPGSPGCLVLVTSRRRLAGLDQTRAVSLDVLPEAEAVSLFADTAGADRVGGQADALHEVVELCGRLPLALRVAAARLRAHRAWTVRHLIDLLSDRQQRLTELETGQRSVTAALDLSYQQLTPAQQHTYRLAGLHPGPDLDLHAAAALVDADRPKTRRLLEDLLDAHLMQEPTPDRYQFHDLTRQHAAATAARDAPEDSHQAALDRLFTHYAHTAALAVDVAYPFEQERRPKPPPSRHPTPDLRTADHATAWLDEERANLLATARYALDHGWLDYPTRLSATVDLFLMTRSRTSDAETLHQLALRAARTADDPDAEIDALLRLGVIHRRAGQYADAEAQYERVLLLTHENGYRRGELDALLGLGLIQRLRGQFTEASGSFSRALDIAEAIDYPSGGLQALLGLGGVYRDTSQHELAAKHFRQGLGLAREDGHRPSEFRALIGLGWAQLALDEQENARDDFGQALDIARTIGYRIGEMVALIGLGGVHRKHGRYETAAGLYEDVLTQARQIGNGNWIFEALQGLGRTRLSLDRPDDALAFHHEALAMAEEMEQPADVARAHDGVAHAHRARSEHDQAQRHWQQALDILTGLGIDGTSEDWEANVSTIRGHLASYDDSP